MNDLLWTICYETNCYRPIVTATLYDSNNLLLRQVVTATTCYEQLNLKYLLQIYTDIFINVVNVNYISILIRITIINYFRLLFYMEYFYFIYLLIIKIQYHY